jgi:hypothetical protein
LIALFDMNVIVSPPNVELGEPKLSDKVTDKLFNEWKGIGIPDSNFI